MNDILCTRDLTKKFKNQLSVNKINLNIQKGDVYGFIGQNGAGKTTTIRLILNLLKPTEGYVELFGEMVTNENIYKNLRRIGSIIETPGFYLNLTGEENLNLHRIMMYMDDKSEITRVLKIVGLKEERKKIVKHYSLGMKQRLGIARALLHNPDFLILDEPTNGLDPKGIVEIRDLITKISNNYGKTILVSSHILAEVEKMVSKIGIIHKGNLLEEITISEYQNKIRNTVLFKVDDLHRATKLVEEHLNIKTEIQGQGFSVSYNDDANYEIIKILVENNIKIHENKIITPTLEDYFMKVTEEV
jgi:bacitracin transport system ATP-binding protein